MPARSTAIEKGMSVPGSGHMMVPIVVNVAVGG
jgi:hypothetical protein